MQRLGRALATLAAPVFLACLFLAHDLAPSLRADGGGGRGLMLRITDRDASDSTALFEGVDQVPDLARIRALGLDDRKHRFEARWTGWLRVPVEGTYGFATHSDDGSRLGLDGSWVVKNGGVHGPRTRSATRTLFAGWYPFELEYTQAGEDLALDVLWDPPGQPTQRIGPESFLADAPGPMPLWWFENVREPVAARLRLLIWIGLISAVSCLSGLVLMASATPALRGAATRVPPAVAAVLAATPVRRRLTGLGLVFAACIGAWFQNEASRGGFHTEYRRATPGSLGPWIEGGTEAGGTFRARGVGAPAELALPIEQRNVGWWFAPQDDFYWFAVGGGLKSSLSIDGAPLISHDGMTARGAATRGRRWLRTGLHRIELAAVRREAREDDGELRWAPPGGSFRRFEAGDVFGDSPGPAQLESQLRTRAARGVVPSVSGALLVILAVAAAGGVTRARAARGSVR